MEGSEVIVRKDARKYAKFGPGSRGKVIKYNPESENFLVRFYDSPNEDIKVGGSLLLLASNNLPLMDLVNPKASTHNYSKGEPVEVCDHGRWVNAEIVSVRENPQLRLNEYICQWVEIQPNGSPKVVERTLVQAYIRPVDTQSNVMYTTPDGQAVALPPDVNGYTSIQTYLPGFPTHPGREETVEKCVFDLETMRWIRSLMTVKMEQKPFAEGGIRHAFMMKSRDGKEYVAKTYKEQEKAKVYFEDAAIQAICNYYAKKFNSMGPPKKVEFLEAFVLTCCDRPENPVLGGELYFPGDFKKYNNNWGGVSEDHRNTPQAFSHFTYVHSKEEIMIVDIQGIGDIYTDPAILSKNQSFGATDMGQEGINRFFATHKCNKICVGLGLSKTASTALGTMMRERPHSCPAGTLSPVAEVAAVAPHSYNAPASTPQAPQAPLKSLPKMKRSGWWFQDCIICFDELYKNTLAVCTRDGRRVCPHYYHYSCLHVALQSNPMCLLCRAPCNKATLVPNPFNDVDSWFQAIDVDKDEKLSIQEVGDFLIAFLPLGTNVITQNINRWWHLWDTDGNGNLDHSEITGLVRWMANGKCQVRSIPTIPDIHEDPLKWFTFWDTDNNGTLEKHELIRAVVKTFKAEGENNRQWINNLRASLMEAWPKYDKDGSGMVDTKEFLATNGLRDMVVNYLRTRGGVPTSPQQPTQQPTQPTQPYPAVSQHAATVPGHQSPPYGGPIAKPQPGSVQGVHAGYSPPRLANTSAPPVAANPGLAYKPAPQLTRPQIGSFYKPPASTYAPSGTLAPTPGANVPQAMTRQGHSQSLPPKAFAAAGNYPLYGQPPQPH